MSLTTTHPLYAERAPEWRIMRDAYAGESAIKAARIDYLKPTKGMILDGMQPKQLGFETYEAYLDRTTFPEYTKEAVEGFIGVMYLKPPVIELPASMEYMRDKATVHGESLVSLLRRINEEQLVAGRVGLLLDMPAKPVVGVSEPYIAMYSGEAVRNWDANEIEGKEASLNLVVLDESGQRRTNNFEWEYVSRYRVLQLGNLTENEEVTDNAVYKTGAFEEVGAGKEPTFVESDMIVPMIRNVPLNKIPFVFVNTKDTVPSPDAPPLLPLARQCLTIYRGEADYRQNLFMQGQDTLVTIGEFLKTNADFNEIKGEEGDSIRTGTGSILSLEAGGDAKYIGVNSNGLTEQREALKNDRQRAETRSGQLIQTTGSEAESGEALQTRVAAQTASLKQIAMTGAAALERILKIQAEWMGANPEEVKVSANTEFAKYVLSGKTLVDVMTARSMGAPITLQSIHGLMVDQGMTKMDFESEAELLEKERSEELERNPPLPGGNPPENDPTQDPPEEPKED